MRRLVAGLLAAGALMLAACDEDEGDARAVAVDWAERVAAGDRAACRVSTERGGAQLAGHAGAYECEDYPGGTEFLADAFLLDSTDELAGGLADADASEAVDAQGDQVQRLSFEPSDGVTLEVDVIDDDDRWLVNDFRAIPDPLGGPGSEAIDEAALGGLDQTDPDAVRVRWAELIAAGDPSACLLFDPAEIYAMIARAPGVDSCSELATSGLLVLDDRGAELVDAAKTAGFSGAPSDPDDRDLELRRYSAQFDDGRRYAFTLVLDDGSWRVKSLSTGRVEILKPGDDFYSG